MKEKLFLITNQGLHPVEPKLKRLYGNDIVIELITVGNVPLSIEYASEVAKKARDIIIRNDDKDVYIVWTGMPIYNNVVYNVAKESLKRNPIFLVYDKDIKTYKEFNIDARYLIFGS